MPTNDLVVTVEATHQSLKQRLREATHFSLDPARARDQYARTDAFLAATSRHLAAVEEVLLPVARRRLPYGAERVRTYLHQAKLLELATAHVKARLYGEVHAAYVPWSDMWDQVQRELDRHNDLELRLAEELGAVLEHSECDRLAERVYRAEVRAPTRAHPYIPHRGLVGRVARRVWSAADRFWDTAEGRVVPQPVRPPSKAHSHDSLMGQYLFGVPNLDDKAPVFEHRRHRRSRHAT